MLKYSLVIPIYERSEILPLCLNSIKFQTLKPYEIIVVDNNVNEFETEKLHSIINNYDFGNQINIKVLKSSKNSGAIARNLGALNSKSDLVAFLDSDVILDSDYYEVIVDYFKRYSDLVAIQGLDRNLIEFSSSFKDQSIFRKILYYFEQFFEISELLNRDKVYVSPSLAISHPRIKNFEYESQWISTCAGVFRRDIFPRYLFPENFVTYSNNEYIYLSYSLFKNKEGLMIYTSKAKYRDIQTRTGRISNMALIYQIQTYDLYLFINLFPKNFYTIFTFFKAKVGQLIFNLLKTLFNRSLSLKNFFLIIISIFYPFFYLRNIMKNDLSFYEKDFYNSI